MNSSLKFVRLNGASKASVTFYRSGFEPEMYLYAFVIDNKDQITLTR